MAEAHLPHAHSVAGSDGGVHHEESDVDIRGVFGFAIGLTLTTIVISLLVLVLFKHYGARASRQPAPEYPLAVQQQNRLPPEPRLQTNPRQDLIDFRERRIVLRPWLAQQAGAFSQRLP